MYSPEVGYTLISIGRLDEKGFSVTFGGGKCTIQAPDGADVGSTPRNDKRLYKVEHEEGMASVVEPTLTLDQFHRRMGHISPTLARKLIQDQFVTGVRLEHTSSNEPFFCASCVHAKAT